MDGIRLRAGITMGDPAGVGPEVALKAVNDLRETEGIIPLIIGRDAVLRELYGELAAGSEVVDLDRCGEHRFEPGKRYIVNVDAPYPLPRQGEGSARTGSESRLYIDAALGLWKRGVIDVLVTGPVNKGCIQKSGIEFTGHTEYIARALGEERPYMMMYSRDFRVLLVTTHIPVSTVPEAVTPDTVLAAIRAGHRAAMSIDGAPVRLAIAGLDPHCGDDGAIGGFDAAVTADAVKKARAEGIDIDGPYAADTLFIPRRWRSYNLVIAHYHDQGLIPFKVLAFDTGVNVTLGLSITRTSVDHGTGYDIAGKGLASHLSMLGAIRLACDLERGKRQAKPSRGVRGGA